MENIEKETASSKFMENPYIEMKKKISVNGIVALVIAILAFVGSSLFPIHSPPSNFFWLCWERDSLYMD